MFLFVFFFSYSFRLFIAFYLTDYHSLVGDDTGDDQMKPILIITKVTDWTRITIMKITIFELESNMNFNDFLSYFGHFCCCCFRIHNRADNMVLFIQRDQLNMYGMSRMALASPLITMIGLLHSRCGKLRNDSFDQSRVNPLLLHIHCLPVVFGFFSFHFSRPPPRLVPPPSYSVYLSLLARSL